MNPLSRLPHLLLASAVAISAAAVAAPPYVPTGGTATGHRTHKPITVTTESAVCPAPATAAGPTKLASDPEEGGQVTHVADATQVQPLKAASDPEEGGQVARTAKSKPSVSEMNVTNKADSASTKMMASAAPPAECAPVQH